MRLLIHDYAGHPFQIQLSRELARRGHTVLHAFAGELQTPRGELVRRDDDPPGFSIQEVAMDADYAKHKYSFRRRRSMEIAYGRILAGLIASWKPDAVLSSNTPTEAQQSALAVAKKCGARFLMWHQDFYSIAVDKLVRKKIPILGALIGKYYRWLERRQLQGSDHIVAITADFVPIMEKEFEVSPEKASVIPNWAPVETLPVLPKDNEWSRGHHIHDRFVFLYTGTLGMKHNPDLLLQLAIQCREHPQTEVVVISEGIGAEWLLTRVKEHGLTNLRILPYQPFSVLPQVLASGDVLVAVLEEDAGVFSVPSKVLTYLCAARPLLLAVPAVNLAARIIQENQAGLTVPPSGTEEFLHAARRLMTDQQTAREMASRARDYAEQQFNITTIGDRFEKLLTTTLSA
ncbi:MAG TPA: glycosyltransferase family 4 protein [Verrucomicrobiales bacterium]|nr:glycosyltransferase family 4 protein [Verrucomicrobiales bacterium]